MSKLNDLLSRIISKVNESVTSDDVVAEVESALEDAKDSGAFKGEQGQRGLSILKTTTAPSSYTTETGGFTPKYRIALSTVKSQASVDEVFVGDQIRYSYYLYPIGYVDSSYAYCDTRVSIRGSAGSTPVKGTDYYTEADKAEMVAAVIAALPTTTGVLY